MARASMGGNIGIDDPDPNDQYRGPILYAKEILIYVMSTSTPTIVAKFSVPERRTETTSAAPITRPVKVIIRNLNFYYGRHQRTLLHLPSLR